MSKSKKNDEPTLCERALALVYVELDYIVELMRRDEKVKLFEKIEYLKGQIEFFAFGGKNTKRFRELIEKVRGIVSKYNL